jgi:hypothetical protein
MAAIFGLLALVIAITFSGASDRFDKRRDLIINELTTMSSAYLSVDLIKAEDQPNLRELFKKYVDLRLEVYKKPIQLEDQAKIFQQRVEVGNQIWQATLKSVNNISSLNFADKLIAAKILPSITAMFDAADYQRMAMQMHPPPEMWALLFFTCLCWFLGGWLHYGSRRAPRLAFNCSIRRHDGGDNFINT